MEEDRVMNITIKNKEGQDVKMWVDLKEWEYNIDWNDWSEYLLWKYPPMMLIQNPGYRIPDREAEEDSFENWKLKGKPKASLFGYGTLIKDEVSKEFTDMIMKK